MSQATVFVVDNDPEARILIRTFLESARLIVTTFESGRDFVDLIGSRCPDCLILNAWMPEMTGFQVHEQMKTTGISTPVVYVTSHEDSRSSPLKKPEA